MNEVPEQRWYKWGCESCGWVNWHRMSDPTNPNAYVVCRNDTCHSQYSSRHVKGETTDLSDTQETVDGRLIEGSMTT